MGSSKFEKLADAAVRCVPAKYRRTKDALVVWLRDNQDAVLEKLFTKENQRISRRTKILAYCVAAQKTAREANKLLYTHGEEMLYSRSLPDITIVRSLTLHHSASKLCELMAKVAPLAQDLPADDFFTRKGRFCCTVRRMEAYLDAERVLAEKTDGITMELLEGIDAIQGDDDEFLDMLKENLSMFSASRECTRRVFVSFLCQWAQSVIQRGDESEIKEMFMNASPKSCPEEWKVNFYALLERVNEGMYRGFLFSPRISLDEISSDLIHDIPLLFMKKDVTCPEEPKSNPYALYAYLETNPEFISDPRQTQRNEYDEQCKCARLLRDYLLGKKELSRTLFLALLVFFLRHTADGELDIHRINDALSNCGWREIDINSGGSIDRLVSDITDFQDSSEKVFRSIVLYDLWNPDEPVFERYEGTDYTILRSQALIKAMSR